MDRIDENAFRLLIEVGCIEAACPLCRDSAPVFTQSRYGRGWFHEMPNDHNRRWERCKAEGIYDMMGERDVS